MNYLEKRKNALEAKIAEARATLKTSEDLAEVRSLGNTISDLTADLEEVRNEMANVAEEAARSAAIGAVKAPVVSARGEVNTESMEYRQAFMNHLQKKAQMPAEMRVAGDNGTTKTTDIGALIPTTVMNEVIKSLEGTYGTLYSKVRKLNVQGGVQFPIAKLGAKFVWTAEGTSGSKTKAGDATGYVQFSYHMGEIKVATTILAAITSLPVFESELAKLIAASYLKAMEIAIVNGTGVGQPLGIAKDTRVTNVVTFTADTIGDWKSWRTDLFAEIPLSLRGKGEFIFTASTVETYLETMSDANDNPLFKIATDGSMGAVSGKFFGREVSLVEPDVVKDFATAAAGDVIGIYLDPNEYAINTNMQFTVARYIDQDTNEIIDKAIVVVDGKMLDTSGCYLIKKA